MSQYCDHLDVSFCERDSFEAIFDDAPDYVGFAQAVTSTRILGYFSTVEALTEAVPHPNIGDTYGIGEEAPYNLYVYSANGWIDNGVPDGPPGPPGPQGNDGAQGPPGPAAAVTAWEVKYQASASGTTTPTGTWSENIPEVPDGQFLWTRTEVTYSDGTTTTSYSVVRGVRGVGLLNITTEPSSYTTVTGGFTPAYRIALSTVKSQSRATEVLVGDTLHYSYYTYPVGYVDASYVYTGVRVSIRGADGNDGAQGPPGPQGNDGKDGSDAEVTAENIAAALGYTPAMVNPNLLGNWYFGNPVNQRGKTSYSGDSLSHGIDRWRIYHLHVELISDHIKLINDYKSNGNFQQQIENASRLIGKTATFSVIMDVVTAPLGFALTWANASGSNWTIKRWHAGDFSSGKKLYYATFTVPDNFSGVSIYVYSSADATDAEIKVYGAKLELGSDQTIAHQENGEWVLNEIPDYGEQLARCQRYYQRIVNVNASAKALLGQAFATTATLASIVLPLPAAMRGIAAVSASGVQTSLNTSSNAIDVSSVAAVTSALPYNTKSINLGGTFTQGQIYSVWLATGGYIELSADL